MNSPLTPRDIAAMTAHAAGIKAENDAYTRGPWRAGRGGCVVSDHPVPEVGGSDHTAYYGGHMVAESISASNVRRIVACVNACAGVPTETLELAASWGDIVKGVMGGARISAEAAAVGAGLDSESLEQGEVL